MCYFYALKEYANILIPSIWKTSGTIIQSTEPQETLFGEKLQPRAKNELTTPSSKENSDNHWPLYRLTSPEGLLIIVIQTKVQATAFCTFINL